VGTRQMRYQAVLASETAERFHFEGFKEIHDDPGFDVWADTTTLFITVRRGESRGGAVVGKGILAIAAADFARALTTMPVLHPASLTERLGAAARFGRFFAGMLQEVYGGVLAGPTAFHPDAPPRKRRVLRAGPPEVHFFSTADGVQLRLLRYRGGSK